MKDLNKLSEKLTVHYAAAFFTYFSAFCMIRSFISVYLSDRGFSYTQVGIITAIHMLITAVIQPLYAQILDRFPKLGLRRFIALCCIPSAICSILTFLLPARLIFFIPLYIIFGLTEIGLQSLMVSVGMEYVNAGVPINAGLGRGFGSMGYAVSNMILGALIVRFGAPVSQKLNILLLAVMILLILFLPDPWKTGGIPQEKTDRDELPSDSVSVFLQKNRVFALFTFSVIFLFFGHSVVNTYMPNVAAQFGKGSDFTGMIVGISAALELLPMMFYTLINRKISSLQLLSISAIFFTVKLLTAALAPNAGWLVVSQFMQILAYALYAMSSIYFTNRAVSPHNRVMAQGLLIGAGEVGFMIESLVGGIILDHMSVRVLLWVGVAISAIGSVMMLSALSQFRKNHITGE
ncbi:MAG: MFS transporter [Flexilinea sp.]|nr:MFS transporter [Flexilinea sp.]